MVALSAPPATSFKVCRRLNNCETYFHSAITKIRQIRFSFTLGTTLSPSKDWSSSDPEDRIETTGGLTPLAHTGYSVSRMVSISIQIF
jgi:hypothetical protein